MSDYFDALAVSDRSICLSIETPKLLRVRENRRQARQHDQLLASVRSQVADQMASLKRHAFREEVSIELTIFAGAGPSPSAPKSVKAYLDALQGIVYSDDHRVGHLTVERFAEDHPARRQAERAGMTTLSEAAPTRESCTVYVVALPLRLYVANYARLFSSSAREQIWDTRRLREETNSVRADDELEELYEERRREERGEPLGQSDPELEVALRGFREERIRELQTRRVLQARLGPGDRPGPDHDAEIDRLFSNPGIHKPAPVFGERIELPDSIWLPRLLTQTTGDTVDWAGLVAGHFEKHRQRWRGFPQAVEEPLGLDIAIFGAPVSTHDVDNVAHTVLRAFERIYCADNRGTVTSYRVYRRSSDEPAVHVKLMIADALRELRGAIEQARERVVEAGLESE
jgi:Holliday junction resolvase RusA-like endonuclease